MNVAPAFSLNVRPSAMEESPPPEDFQPPSPFGDQYLLVGIVHIIFHFCLLLLQFFFLRGLRNLCGWKSEFSCTLLAAIAISAIQSFLLMIISVICCLTVEFKHQLLYRCLGAFFVVPTGTVIILNILLTVHRFVYTLFPLRGQYLFPPRLAKSILGMVAAFPVFFSFFMSTDFGYSYMGYRFLPFQFVISIKGGRPLTKFLLKMSIISDWLTVINPVAYPIIFVIIYMNKRSLRGSKEIRMTIQALLSGILDIVFFFIWVLLETGLYDHWVTVIVISFTKSAYLASCSIIYLSFNRRIKKKAFSPICFRNQSNRSRNVTSHPQPIVKVTPQTVVHVNRTSN